MKSKMIFIASGMILAFIIHSWANGPKSPKQLEAGWAKLSDRAQIELLLDELRSVMLAENHSSITENLKIKNGRKHPEIFIKDHDAIVEFENGNQVILQKTGQQWRIVDSAITSSKTYIRSAAESETQTLRSPRGFSAGKTFIESPVSSEHRIEKLSRRVTQVNLERSLFGAPEKTASYYSAVYSQNAPYVSTAYIQFVTDPAWNRIVYGSLNRWIKSYENLSGPSAIAVDAAGRVFIGESGRQRILVMQLAAETENAELEFLFEIPGIGAPADIALDDNGTPLEVADDFLYVADAVANQIVKFALEAHSARQIAAFSDFDSPANVLAGKWNGANNDWLYVIDKAGKRLQLFEDNGEMLHLLRQINAHPGEYFHALKADHFGNIYLVETMNSQLRKYTADLEFLDAESGGEQFNDLANLDIGFGKISVEGEGTFWAGFDQLFTLERWTDGSGAQRRILGVAMKDAAFQASAGEVAISGAFTLTDFADVAAKIFDRNGLLIHETSPGWMVSGRKALFWNRRDTAGRQVAAGQYRWEIAATSPYREETVTLAAQLYLPLFYWQNSGGGVADDEFRKQGTPVRWGDSPTETANEDPEKVVYRFSGLNPQSEYQVAFEFYAGDGEIREQVILANETIELAAVNVTATPLKTAFIQLPAESFASGEVTIIIKKRRGVSAVISQVWIQETGVPFSVQPYSEKGGIPSAFALEDNFPNPFNPSTNIRFQLPQQANVTLEIFNILGQKIRVLAQGNLAAGTHTVSWNGRNDSGAAVSSGIYFYRLTAGEFVATKRMLLMK